MASQPISLAGILQFFKENEKAIRNGELTFNSGFILDLRISNLTLYTKVRAFCYSVSLTIDGSGGMSKATSEIPQGNWAGSHMAAVAIFANKQELSKIYLPNSWIVRPKQLQKR